MTPGDPTFDMVVTEVAGDLRLSETELRSWFSRWVHLPWPHEGVPAEWAGPCYAVYRLTKMSSAFRMAQKSREQWRARAIELGSPPHLATRGATMNYRMKIWYAATPDDEPQVREGLTDEQVEAGVGAFMRDMLGLRGSGVRRFEVGLGIESPDVRSPS